MRLKLKYKFSVLLFLFIALKGYTQDPMMLLNNSTPIYFNPALTGHEDYTRVSLNYRNHFPAVGRGFVTYNASFDTYFSDIESGIGIAIMHDQPGSKAFNYSSAMLAYSYRLHVNKNSVIQAGILGNLYYSVNDPSKLIFSDMIDNDGSILENTMPYERTTKMGVDFGTGLLYRSQQFMIGGAIYHIGNKNDSSYHHAPLKFNIHAELKIPLYRKQTYGNPQSGLQNILKQSYIKPHVLYWQQDYTKITRIGVDLQTKNVGLGLASRQDIKFKSMIFSGRISFAASFLEIDYVFDIGKLGDNFKGLSASSHEVGIIFKFGETKDF